MTRAQYHPISILLHWLVVVLLIAAFAVIELKGQFPKGSEARELTKTIHGFIGQIIFVIITLRLFVRVLFGVPEPKNASPALALLSKAMFWLLYAILLIAPVFGILYFQYAGKKIHFFGLVWPQLVTPKLETKKLVEGIHEFLGNSLYFLIGIHVLAGLWHHYIVKDGTLQRMLPKGKTLT
jgi:cytochrome b561